MINHLGSFAWTGFWQESARPESLGGKGERVKKGDDETWKKADVERIRKFQK